MSQLEPIDPHPAEPAQEPPIEYHVPIPAWREEDRPREKLLKHGPDGLSDAELTALLLGSGTRTGDGSVSAVQLARTLLRTFGGSFHALSGREVKEWMRVRGIGEAKAVRLAAAFEIGRRVESQRQGERIQVTSPGNVAAVYGPLMRDRKREIFKIVLLNTANVIIDDVTLSEGGLAASVVEPRAVFQRAILSNAASVICLHNHPSGNTKPSREDIRITRQLVEAGKIMGIPVQDHIIIAGRDYTSLADRGIV